MKKCSILNIHISFIYSTFNSSPSTLEYLLVHYSPPMNPTSFKSIEVQSASPSRHKITSYALFEANSTISKPHSICKFVFFTSMRKLQFRTCYLPTSLTKFVRISFIGLRFLFAAFFAFFASNFLFAPKLAKKFADCIFTHPPVASEAWAAARRD